jgi:hypothetical protein
MPAKAIAPKPNPADDKKCLRVCCRISSSSGERDPGATPAVCRNLVRDIVSIPSERFVKVQDRAGDKDPSRKFVRIDLRRLDGGNVSAG